MLFQDACKMILLRWICEDFSIIIQETWNFL